MLQKLLKKNLFKILKSNILLDKNEKAYILHNKIVWKKTQKVEKSIVLIDLFNWYPLIHFWSYLTNIIAAKNNSSVKYYYFEARTKNQIGSKYSISKLEKIYKSFNAFKGITSYDFKYSSEELKKYNDDFIKVKNNPTKLSNYKLENIKIGDLIYDTYLFTTRKSKLDFEDPILKDIFLQAQKIFFTLKEYFKKNKITCVIPSHTCYVSYGIITRIALKSNIPVIKIKCENWANAFFRLLKIDKKAMVDEQPYYNYSKVFKKFSNKEQNLAIEVGKNILDQRISGNYDKNLPYMKISQFNKNKKKLLFKNKKNKPKVFIFPHCFYDNPHRYQSMVFNDFYEQIDYLLNLSNKITKYDWFYKPHPNELLGKLNIHNEFMKKYPNVTYLAKDISHRQILELKPKCVVTNHGTIGHEYANFKVPVINTGDNPHINYQFCLHAKNKSNLEDIFLNLDKYIKKINFDKKKIYEYLFLHYDYFPNRFNKCNLLRDDYFASKNIKLNAKSKILKMYIKDYKHNDKNIKEYIKNFIYKNL